MADSLKYKTKIGLYWKFVEQFATYGVQFVVGIVMARLLSPKDFGIAALPAVFIAVAQIFVDGSFGLALIRKPEVSERDLATTFYYSIGVGMLFYVILFVAAPFISDFYGIPILTSLIRVTALTFIWSPLSTPQGVILTRRLDFKTPARVAIINRIVAALVGIGVAYSGYGIWALIVSTVVSSFIGTVQMWLAVKWIPRAKFACDSFRYIWNFGNKMMVVRVINAFYNNIITILVGKMGNVADLGNLNRARGFVSVPSSNLVGMLSAVTFPVLSKLQDNDELLAASYRRMIKVSSFVAFPAMLLMMALAKPMVVFLVTEKWLPCVILLQIMSFTYMLQPIQILNLNLLQVKGRTDLTLRLEIIKKIVFVPSIIVAVQYGMVTLCVVDFCLTIFALVMNTYYTGKLINVGLLKQLSDVLPALLISGLAIGAATGAAYYVHLPFAKLCAGGSAGVLAFLFFAKIFRCEELSDIRYMLSRRS